MTGRPSTYTPEIGARICELLIEGNSLRKLCRENDDLPTAGTVCLWLTRHPDFAEHYTRAREAQSEAMLEETFEIADECNPGEKTITKETEKGTFVEVVTGDMVERSKLRVDIRKWALARMAPKKYGELIKSEVSGPNGGPIEISDDERARRLKLIFDAAQARKGAADANAVDDLL